MIAQHNRAYPALIAALVYDRKPSFGEMRSLVRRIRREVTKHGSQTDLHRTRMRSLVSAVLQGTMVQVSPKI